VLPHAKQQLHCPCLLTVWGVLLGTSGMDPWAAMKPARWVCRTVSCCSQNDVRQLAPSKKTAVPTTDAPRMPPTSQPPAAGRGRGGRPLRVRRRRVAVELPPQRAQDEAHHVLREGAGLVGQDVLHLTGGWFGFVLFWCAGSVVRDPLPINPAEQAPPNQHSFIVTTPTCPSSSLSVVVREVKGTSSVAQYMARSRS
jgi:hypothetical protein